jgi:hypothetical protein
MEIARAAAMIVAAIVPPMRGLGMRSAGPATLIAATTSPV